MANWQINGVYHGANLTGSPFAVFDDKFTGKGYDVAGGGHYFTDCRDTAMQYARKIKEDAEIGSPYLYIADISLERPFIRMNRDNCEPICLPMARHQAVSMIRACPTIYDKENSPLRNFGFEGFDTNSVAKFADRIVHNYMDGDGGVNINSLENDFFQGNPTVFRRLLQIHSGFDGVIVSFGDANNFVCWFTDQIEIKEVWNDRERIR